MRRTATAFFFGTCLMAASPALADDFSFTGTFTVDNDTARFDFVVGATSEVTLVTYSYAGGTNAAGQTIARGGFDPILSLYDTASGALISYDDDGPSGTVPTDLSGAAYDTFLQSSLDPGSYTVFVSQFDDFGPDNYLTGSFRHADDPNFSAGFGCAQMMFCDVSGNPDYNSRDGHWAFDLLNVDTAVGPPAVPEPATWAMMIGGFGLMGAAMRRRRVSATVSYA